MDTGISISVSFGDGRPLTRPTADLGTPDGRLRSLLEWLETQLGLSTIHRAKFDRIAQFAQALENAHPEQFVPSIKRDWWGTARECLWRMDELRLTGWDGECNDRMPPLVHALAAVRGLIVSSVPDEAARLRRALVALDTGQGVPRHEVILAEPKERWPKLWQLVLERLNTRDIEPTEPSGRKGSSLASVQGDVLSGTARLAQPDASLRWLQIRSEVAACEV